MKLVHGDCLEKMKDISSGSVDLTVTSPPYDNLRTYNGNNDLWNEQVWKDCIKALYREINADIELPNRFYDEMKEMVSSHCTE